MSGAFLYASIVAFIFLISKSYDLRKIKIHEIALMSILFVFGIELFISWLFYSEKIVHFPHLMRVNSPFVFLIAPGFYLYFVSKIGVKKEFYRNDILHLVPFLFIVIYFSPFYFSSSIEKIELYTLYKEGTGTTKLPVTTIYRSIQFLYVVWIIAVWIKNKKRVVNSVLMLTIFFISLWFFGVWRSYFINGTGYVWISHLLLSVFLLGLLFLELRRSKEVNKKKYTTSGLDNSRSQMIALEIKRLLIDEELYKQSTLTLNDIAENLQVHQNYVSQAINNELDINFRDFVNSLRVEEAKKLLSDSSYNNYTLQAISEMSGFNSVSSFNSLFKRQIGSTPSAFKKKIQ